MLHIYDDEVNEPLTPSHLMYGRRLLSIKVFKGGKVVLPLIVQLRPTLRKDMNISINY